MRLSKVQQVFRENLTRIKWENRDTDKEDVEIGVEMVCEEIESLMERLDGEKNTFILMNAIMCLIEHHITEGFESN